MSSTKSHPSSYPKHEAGMREYTVIFLISIPCAIYLGESPVERILMLGAGLLVILMEHLNSAIEATLGRISTEHHDLTGTAKDMGSAAVFVAALFFVYVWGEFVYRGFFMRSYQQIATKILEPKMLFI